MTVTEFLKTYANAQYVSLDKLYPIAQQKLLRSGEGSQEFKDLIERWFARWEQGQYPQLVVYTELPFAGAKLRAKTSSGKEFASLLVKLTTRKASMLPPSRTAVIKPCRQKDKKGDKPLSSQKVCLYSKKDPTKLLGRHPSEQAARQQEKAIHVNKKGSAMLPKTLVYHGATYKLAADPEAYSDSTLNDTIVLEAERIVDAIYASGAVRPNWRLTKQSSTRVARSLVDHYYQTFVGYEALNANLETKVRVTAIKLLAHRLDHTIYGSARSTSSMRMTFGPGTPPNRRVKDSASAAINLFKQQMASTPQAEVVAHPDPQVSFVWLVLDYTNEIAGIVYLQDQEVEEVDFFEAAEKYGKR